MNTSIFSLRNIMGLVLLIVSLICLYPGITLPLLQLQANATFPIIGTVELYNETQSIIESVRSLWESNNRLVAFLILLFSIVVPVFKALLLLLGLGLNALSVAAASSPFLIKFVQTVGKWSMADVFVVSVFMAFLATHSNQYLDAILHPGFYYFLAYCIISICSSLCIKIDNSTIVIEKSITREVSEG